MRKPQRRRKRYPEEQIDTDMMSLIRGIAVRFKRKKYNMLLIRETLMREIVLEALKSTTSMTKAGELIGVSRWTIRYYKDTL